MWSWGSFSLQEDTSHGQVFSRQLLGRGFHLWDFEGMPGPGQWWARNEFHPKGTDPKLFAAGGRGISPLISPGFELTLVPGGQCEVLLALAWWGLWGEGDAHSSVGQLGGHLSAQGTALRGLKENWVPPSSSSPLNVGYGWI